jgi:hypothetical protein
LRFKQFTQGVCAAAIVVKSIARTTAEITEASRLQKGVRIDITTSLKHSLLAGPRRVGSSVVAGGPPLVLKNARGNQASRTGRKQDPRVWLRSILIVVGSNVREGHRERNVFPRLGAGIRSARALRINRHCISGKHNGRSRAGSPGQLKQKHGTKGHKRRDGSPHNAKPNQRRIRQTGIAICVQR